MKLLVKVMNVVALVILAQLIGIKLARLWWWFFPRVIRAPMEYLWDEWARGHRVWVHRDRETPFLLAVKNPGIQAESSRVSMGWGSSGPELWADWSRSVSEMREELRLSFHFVLKRSGWGYDDLYEALKTGVKTSEWRDGSDHWRSRLLTEMGRTQIIWADEFKENNYPNEARPYVMAFPGYLWKYNRARFMVGYTKYPRLIADVIGILYYSKTNQFEIKLGFIREEMKWANPSLLTVRYMGATR